MILKIINFAVGFLIGSTLALIILLSQKAQENVLTIPSELPKDNIEFEIINLPKNLEEVTI